MESTIKILGGTALKGGIQLPSIGNVTVSDNAQIVAKNSFIRIDSDLV